MGSIRLVRFALVFCGLLSIALAGCQPADEENAASATATGRTAEKPQKLRVLSVDDPEQVAARIAQVWTAQTTGEIDLIYGNSAELFASDRPLRDCDIVIFPATALGEWLGRDAIAPLDLEQLRGLGADRRQLLKHDRTTVVQSAGAIYGASLGSPMLMLLYRKDVFEKLKLSVPRTWPEYQATLVALRAAASAPGEGSESLPTDVCVPTAGNWLAEYFLARVAGSIVRQGRLSSYFEVESMKPLINSPPFVDALEQIVAESKLRVIRDATPAECYSAIVTGTAALVVTWPTSHPAVENVGVSLAIGVASLPAAERSYDYRDQKWKPIAAEDIRPTPLIPIAGRIASIASETRRLKTALRFTAWLMTADANREFSTQFADLLFVQNGQLADPYSWVNEQLPREAAQQMSDVLQTYHDQALVMPNVRVMGRAEYMQILADAIRNTLEGRNAPQAALDGAAKQWEQLTDKIGRDKQRKLFQDSVRMER